MLEFDEITRKNGLGKKLSKHIKIYINLGDKRDVSNGSWNQLLKGTKHNA